MKFNTNNFNINVVFNKHHDNHWFWHSKDDNKIYLDVVHWIKNQDSDWSKEGISLVMLKYIIHELTHWFDETCWSSTQYKTKDAEEHLAVFVQQFLLDIYDLAHQIIGYIEKKKWLEAEKENNNETN